MSYLQRVEELGWDREGHSYFVLDDNRLYRRTDAPLPPEPKKTKAKPKARKSRGTRTSKRRKLSSPQDSEDEQEDVTDQVGNESQQQPTEDDDFGGMKWECIAVTHQDYQDFLESIRKSSDADEKALRQRIIEEVMPELEKEARKQVEKAQKVQRELEIQAKMEGAKRSSRLAGKKEQLKQKEEEEAAEKKRQADLAMARKEQEKQKHMEEVITPKTHVTKTAHLTCSLQARESRMLTREQRLKEREVKRILHEEELKKLEENSKNMENTDARMSERNLKLEMERRQRELDKLAEEEDEWIFDCAVCGMHGENLDDGTHSIACEKCNIWQHSKCHGIKEEDAESDDFHFVCNDCIKKEEEARKPKIPPLRLRMGASNSPQLERARPYLGPNGTPQPGVNGTRPIEGVFIYNDSRFESPRPASAHPHLMEGPALSPQGQSPGPPGYHPHGPSHVGIPQQAWNGTTLPPPPRAPSVGNASSPPRPQSQNGYTASPPPFQLHNQAHASAISSSHLPHHQPHVPNGQNGFMGPPSPQKGGASRPSSSYDDNNARRSFHASNGATMTPQPPRPSMSPGAHHIAPPTLSYSPNTSFPPPSRPQQFQQAAGHSPTKQTSSPVHDGSAMHPAPIYTPSSSQHQHRHNATPQTHMSSHNILRPSPNAALLHSSPIPPLPLGNTPLIPQKHDTPRPVSRDSIGEIPVLPAGIKMSPSPATSFARPGSSSGNGHLPSFGSFQSYGSQHPESSQQQQQSSTSIPAPRPESDTRIHHGEMVEGGGVRGVETELGVGSVPVKKMMPLSSPAHPSASPFSDFRDTASAQAAVPGAQAMRSLGDDDVVMRDS